MTKEDQAKSLPNLIKEAVNLGVKREHADFIIGLNKRELEAFKEMIEYSKKLERGMTRKHPSIVLGGIFKDILNEVTKKEKELDKKLKKITKPISNKELPNIQENVISRLKNISKLNGITVEKDWGLNFNKAELDNKINQKTKNSIEESFKDLKELSTFQLHQRRWGLRNWIEQVRTQSASKDKLELRAIEAIRKGVEDSLSQINEELKQKKFYKAKRFHRKLRDFIRY